MMPLCPVEVSISSDDIGTAMAVSGYSDKGELVWPTTKPTSVNLIAAGYRAIKITK
jgi:hypothetical protein